MHSGASNERREGGSVVTTERENRGIESQEERAELSIGFGRDPPFLGFLQNFVLENVFL